MVHERLVLFLICERNDVFFYNLCAGGIHMRLKTSVFIMVAVLAGMPQNGYLSQFVVDSMIKVTKTESSYPYWSPDGTKIICTRTKDGNKDIVIITLNELNQFTHMSKEGGI